MNQPKQARAESEAIYLCKGLAIILVLLGHFGSIDWWPPAYRQIVNRFYQFHMPLFVLLSGYLAARGDRVITSLESYGLYMRRRSARLLMPYLTISLVFVLIKVAGQIVFRYNPVTEQTLINFLLYPAHGPASVLWFLYTLFLITALFPLVRLAVPSDLLLGIGAAGLLFIPAPEVLGLDRLVRFSPFFIWGYLLARHRLLFRVRRTALLVPSAVVFLYMSITYGELFMPAPPVIAGVAALSGSMLFLVISLMWAERGLTGSVVRLWGVESATIYLFHQPIMWAVCIATLKLLGPGWPLLAGLVPALTLGLFAPIVFELWVLRKSRALSFAFLGAAAQRVS